MTAAQDRATGDYSAFWDARNYLDDARNVEASVFVVDGRNDWNVKPHQWARWWEELARYDVPRARSGCTTAATARPATTPR